MSAFLSRYKGNFRIGMMALQQLRAKYLEEGKAALWVVSYVFAPGLWVIFGIVSVYFAITDTE